MKEKIKIALFFVLSAICGYVCGYFAAENQLLGLAMCILFIFLVMVGYAISLKIYMLEDFLFFGNHTEIEAEEITEEKTTEEHEDIQTAE